MFAKVMSATIVGLDAFPINVEVDVMDAQLPGFTIVGLADKSVQEARERIMSAIRNSGYNWPRKKIVVNLAPADIPKYGTGFDLAIAIGILLASKEIKSEKKLDNIVFVGELALNGQLRKVSGVLPISSMIYERKFLEIYVPYDNASEACLIEDVKVLAARNLSEVVNDLNGNKHLLFFDKSSIGFQMESKQDIDVDFKDIKGQKLLKRVSLIAAAGGHNMILVGPPGAGKTMAARALRHILPDMSYEESIEVTKIYSIAGLLGVYDNLILKRPFRAPHHTASSVSIVGGGKFPKPGEVTLAHRGILFLDELPEFAQTTIDSLRQAIEDGKVLITRAAGVIEFPSKFMLVAAMNPCKCGWLGDSDKQCTCTPSIIERYRSKVSGPIMDRIDLQVRVEKVNLKTANSDVIAEDGMNSDYMKKIVIECRRIQKERYKKWPELRISSNSDVPAKLLNDDDVLEFEPEARNYLIEAADKIRLSVRSYHKVKKVARTIADLEGAVSVSKVHVNEALFYRFYS